MFLKHNFNSLTYYTLPLDEARELFLSKPVAAEKTDL